MHHAKDNPKIPGIARWNYEKKVMTAIATPNLLARIIIAKVVDPARIEIILSGIPLSQEDPDWNCVVWVKDALTALDVDNKALGTRQLEWKVVRDKALLYVKQKKDAGRYKIESKEDPKKPPTYDLLSGSELLR